MPEYIINGIPVLFPFEPYDVQKNYMSKVIDCLQNATNGVLESPTGTGKTLSLICSSLAWLLHERSKHDKSDVLDMKSNAKMNNLTPEQALAFMENSKIGVAKIIYATRTHSQLSQAMQELKNTSYNFFRAITLGSRDQLCIHPEVSKTENNASKTSLCREKVKARSCTFHSRVERVKDQAEITQAPIRDIEDLITVGYKMKACPYYLSKELVERADILFMPYNYLLDAKARKANKLDVQNSVIILDEAHNVEKMCEESGSGCVKSSDIALAIEDTSSIIGAMLDSGGTASSMDGEDGEKLEFTMDDLLLLKEILLSLEKAVNEVPIMFSNKGSTFPGTYVFELLEKANVKFSNANIILQVLGALVTYIASSATKNIFQRRGAGLQALADFLEVVFSGNGPEYQQAIEKCFKVHVEQEVIPAKGGKKFAVGWTNAKQSSKVEATGKARVVNFWCFNPGFGMRQLFKRNIRSIILTSGTLAPLKPLISELGIPVEVCLENPHIIGRNQVYVRIVSQGPDRVTLNSNFSNRNSPEYIASLGRTVLSLCPVIPGGFLIFFPSYPMLNRSIESWQSSGMWAQINRAKTVFIEPRGKDMFAVTMGEYYARLQEPGSKGAIFMAVCRGKVSEGLDFADGNGRAVMITGLPFPPLMDARIVLKKQYLETNRSRENELISGDEWYSLEASRAVNQAIGRVIRHKDDFGAILLCDERFQQHRQKAQLSSWIQKNLQDGHNAATFGSVVGELSRFFRNQKQTAIQAQVRECCVKQEPVPHDESASSHKAVPRSNSALQRPHTTAPSVSFQLNDYLHNPAPRNAAPSTTAAGKFLPHLDCNTHSLNIGDTLLHANVDTYGSEGGAATGSGMVTIYKRERHDRGSEENSPTTDKQSKKRKLVLVPNATVKYNVIVKQEPNSEAVDHFGGSPPDAKEALVRQAPENRVDFLKEIKASIDEVNYKLFLQAITQYHRDSDFPSFITKIAAYLDGQHVHHMLKAMRRFVKHDHKLLFDEHMNRMGL